MQRRTTFLLWILGVLLFLCLGTQGCLTPGLSNAPAAPLQVEIYEVKFLLKAESFLKSPEAPIEESRPEVFSPYFTMAPTVRSQPMAIRFLDDQRLSLHEAAWAVRVRQVLGTSLEIVYKKRYPMDDGNEGHALATAQQDGFPFRGEGKSKVEVDWSHHGRSLSLSYEIETPGSALSFETLQQFVTSSAPEPSKSLTVAQVLQQAKVCGPIEARRWTGSWKDVDDKVDIEVWSVPRDSGGTEPIVEISFKAKSLDKARSKRDTLEKILKKNGWLFEQGEPKTELVLRRCMAASR